MTKNPQFHGCAKHIDIKYHFICEQVNCGHIKLRYCPIDEMTADVYQTIQHRHRNQGGGGHLGQVPPPPKPARKGASAPTASAMPVHAVIGLTMKYHIEFQE